MKRKGDGREVQIQDLKEIYHLVRRELDLIRGATEMPNLEEEIGLELIDAALIFRDYQEANRLAREGDAYFVLMAQILRFWHSGDEEEKRLIQGGLRDLRGADEQKQKNALTFLASAFAKWGDPDAALKMLEYRREDEDGEQGASQVLVYLVYFGHIQKAQEFASKHRLSEDPEFQYALVSYYLSRHDEKLARQIAAKITDPFARCDAFMMLAITEEIQRTIKTEDLKEVVEASREIEDPAVRADVLLEILEEILDWGNGAFSVCAFVQECNV